MRMRLRILLGLSALAVASPSAQGALAEQACDSRAYNTAIDETARTLRNLNRDSEIRFQERLRTIGASKGWTEAQMALKSADAMDDSRLGNFNDDIERLVAEMDALSAAKGTEISCDKLNDLKNVRDRLVTVMGQKSGFILAQLEAQALQPPAPPAARPIALQPDLAEKSARQPAAAGKPAQDQTTSAWKPSIAHAPNPERAAAKAHPQPPVAQDKGETKVAALTPAPPPDAPLPPLNPSGGYTVQEIREAGQGPFGAVTSEFAILVNYAFKKFGQPNGYIIGDEGGGAFLAGLRFGDGQLYTRINGTDSGPTRIYWQGPSVGVDVGATGSRSMFLVYRLDDANSLYRRFPGIDGSAYVVGGLGLTVFKSHDTLIVPIRTGLGLRLGASLAYLKFTERQSWNPF